MTKRKFRLHDGKKGAALTVRVTPRARRTEIGEVMKDGTLRIRVQAPPSKGKANRALIAFLSEVLGVHKSRVEIVAGSSGLDKIVSILDMTADQAQARIEEELGKTA